jgi:RNA polymerase sigma factor (sigma-70 family)
VQQIEDLVAMAAAGDAGAWSDLVDRFAGLVWSVARSVGLSDADSSDVSQTTWMRFAEHLEDLRDSSRVGPWLATTARREAIRVSRLGARQVPVDPWGWLDQADILTEDPESAAVSKERAIAVQLAMTMIPERCRLLLTDLASDPPVPYSEISVRLGMPVGSIGSARSRCLSRLATIIEDWEDDVAADSTVSERTSW